VLTHGNEKARLKTDLQCHIRTGVLSPTEGVMNQDLLCSPPSRNLQVGAASPPRGLLDSQDHLATCLPDLTQQALKDIIVVESHIKKKKTVEAALGLPRYAP
jgi:hypothetical protein